jgi:hypothetical protein
MSKSFNTVHNFGQVVSAQTYDSVTFAGSSLTVTPGNSGDVIVLNATSGSAVTLPAPAAGFKANFVVGLTAASHTISAPSAVVYGNVLTANTTGGIAITTAKTNIATTAGSVIGDRISVTSDGVNYYISGFTSRYNGIALS